MGFACVVAELQIGHPLAKFQLHVISSGVREARTSASFRVFCGKNLSSIYATPHIFSGVSIPINRKLCTNRRSTNSVTLNKNARFTSSVSDKMWCL